MKQENYLELPEDIFILKNASESEVKQNLVNRLKINYEQAGTLVDFIELMGQTSRLEDIDIDIDFPEYRDNCISCMMITKKYSINISMLALASLTFILGLVPVLSFGLSTFDFVKVFPKVISRLTDREKAMAIFLNKLSYDGKEELSLVSIRRTFKKYFNNNPNVNFQDDINTLLDSLDEKGIIKIKTEKIKVLK
jgi:type I site-specific restriction-modification system, R (restriction) subunit and related helicases